LALFAAFRRVRRLHDPTIFGYNAGTEIVNDWQ
jgi:hypothetical protein